MLTDCVFSLPVRMAAALPPSPPGTDSTGRTIDSPMDTKNSPGLTPPKSPTSRTPTPPTPGSSPLPPLPPEVFLLMLRYVEPAERYDLCRVSRSWYGFLVSEPVLWPTLHHLHLHRDQSQLLLLWVNRANYHIKQRGGINSVWVNLRNARQMLHEATPVGRMREICDLLEQSSVPVVQDHTGRRFHGLCTLRHFRLFLEPDTHAAFEVLAILVRRSHHVTFYSLATLDIATRLQEFIIHSHFFAIWPNLESLKISNHPYTLAPNQRALLHDWSAISCGTSAQRTSCENLRCIELIGITIDWRFIVYPMPVLTSLLLSGVTWNGRSFFYLLRITRASLVNLDCTDLLLEEVDGQAMEDWQMYVMVTDPELVDDHIFPDFDSQSSEEPYDEPAPIHFSRLQRICLSGEDTPPFFASLEFVESASSLPTPIFVMPCLLHASFVEMSADLESFPEDSEGALATFGRNAPNLLTLSLYNSCLSDIALFHCLAGLMGKLQVLNLCSTTITDKLIARLPALVPRLRELDVTGCDDVSLQGVARCVEVMRDPDDEKRKLKVIKVDGPRYFDADYEAWAWLDWIGVLHRDEWDHTGLGPSAEIDGGNARRQWIVAGKKDSLKEERRIREERAAIARAKELETQARLIAIYGFQPGGTSSAGTVGGSSMFGGGSYGGSSMGRVLSSATTNGINSPATDANSVFPLDPALATINSRDGTMTRGRQAPPSNIVPPQLAPHPLAYHPLAPHPHVVPSSNGQHATIAEIVEGARALVEEEYSTDSEEEMEEVM